ncbi:hypothetical protein BDV12DRAFT_210611 [Aspergillus spectabilis]
MSTPETETQGTEIYPLARDEAESRRRIPLDRISSIADVGTGTGTWLSDTPKLLDQSSNDSKSRYYLGFDMSPAQFPPTNAAENMQFSHHNRYDLVHVRLLVTAFPTHFYETAVKNLLTILKPGGYLQWLWLKFFELNGLSESAPSTIEEAYKRAGLLNVVNTSFHLYERPELLKRRVRDWQLQAFGAVVPSV